MGTYAFKGIDIHFNIAVMTIARRLFPGGWDVAEDAPGSLEELTQHIADTGRMLVWSGGSDATIFGDAEHNYAFRAWHDWHHWKWQLPFTLEGEAAVCDLQKDDLDIVYGLPVTPGERFRRSMHYRLIDCEINGKLKYSKMHGGEFPVDQIAFARMYLISPSFAVSHAY